MMKIRIRTKDGDWQAVDNKQKERCDLCRQILWIAPDGKPYCNSHFDHHQPENNI